MAWSMRQARNETSNPFLGPSRPVESNSAVGFGSNALDDHVDQDVRKPACSFFDARYNSLSHLFYLCSFNTCLFCSSVGL